MSPNPGSGKFTITAMDAMDTQQLLAITDQNGRQVVAMNLSGETSQQLSLADLKSGLYRVQIKIAKGNIGVKQVRIVNQIRSNPCCLHLCHPCTFTLPCDWDTDASNTDLNGFFFLFSHILCAKQSTKLV